MKKEYILYYFDLSFKDKVDTNIFNEAKNHLFNLVVSYEDLNIEDLELRNFTKKYYEIHDIAERKLKRVEDLTKSDYFKSLSLFKRLNLKRNLKSCRNLYSNFGKFDSMFYKIFGISLVKVIDSINCEKIEQNSSIKQDNF